MDHSSVTAVFLPVFSLFSVRCIAVYNIQIRRSSIQTRSSSRRDTKGDRRRFRGFARANSNTYPPGTERDSFFLGGHNDTAGTRHQSPARSVIRALLGYSRATCRNAFTGLARYLRLPKRSLTSSSDITVLSSSAASLRTTSIATPMSVNRRDRRFRPGIGNFKTG